MIDEQDMYGGFVTLHVDLVFFRRHLKSKQTSLLNNIATYYSLNYFRTRMIGGIESGDAISPSGGNPSATSSIKNIGKQTQIQLIFTE